MRISRQPVVLATVLSATLGCRAPAPGPDLQVVGESQRVRIGAPVPTRSPLFDGTRVELIAARGETLGVQILHRDGGAVRVRFSDAAGVTVQEFAVAHHHVARPSTEMYGASDASQGAGDYADGLTPAAAPTTDPAYVELAIDPGATPGVRTGELIVGARALPITLTIAPITMPPIDRAPYVWAYADPRELEATFGTAAGEHQCIELFRRAGVLWSPDLALADWPARRAQLAGMTVVPVSVSRDPATIGADVRAWIAATAGTGQVPFAIPIDEPHGAAARAAVRVLADAAHAAGGGPGKFLYAVTDYPHPEYGDAIDLYLSAAAVHLDGDRVVRWTYNGKPPQAGAMVLDAASPGMRTWGWIGWRWHVPLWHVWHAAYWHDRYNRHGAPLPGRALDPADAVSFDDGEDHGNFDGVLALPGTADAPCMPTLRLAALRRGIQDRALLELASHCDAPATSALAAALIPTALGDADLHAPPSWPTDDAPFELARRNLITIASRCANP